MHPSHILFEYLLMVYLATLNKTPGCRGWSGKAVSKNQCVYYLKITAWQIKGKARLFVRTKIESIHYEERKNYVLLLYVHSDNVVPKSSSSITLVYSQVG